MKRWRRRIIYALAALLCIVVLYTFLYRWAMFTFEGEYRSFSNSLQVVVEALTTAGFGGDTHAWESTGMNLLVVMMNLTGVILVFLAVPVFVYPMLEEALERSYPKTTTLENHVIICGYARRDAVLIEELSSEEIDFLFIESDLQKVDRLIDDDIPVIRGDPEDIETFRNANAELAKAVVADINDETNPTVILSAIRVNPELAVYSVARKTEVTTYHRLAGAEEVVEAPAALGTNLGMRAVTSFAEKFRATIEVESDFEVTELLVEEDSELVGSTLGECDILIDLGITVFGGWFDGKFLISPGPDTMIEPNTILLVGGAVNDSDYLKTRTLPSHETDPDRVIIAGHGVVGTKAQETIEAQGFDTTVIDIDDHSGVDLVGDVTDPSTLKEADLSNARAIVLALDQDTTTIFTTLILSEIAPDLEIIARVHNSDNVWKVYNAGADFAISMATITGKMLASLIIDHKEILIPQTDFEFVRTKAPTLVGKTLEEAHIRASTGCTVVAIERGEELITELGPAFEIVADDVLLVAGEKEDTERLIEFVH